MKRIWKWLGQVYARLLHRNTERVPVERVLHAKRFIETYPEVGQGIVTHGDLMIAARSLPQALADKVLAEYGADIHHIGRVPVERLAEALYAIQHTDIPESYRPRAKAKRVVAGRHCEAETLYEIVMQLWDPNEMFESATIRDMIVERGYAATSHSPTLSDLTALGYLESLGEGWYAFTKRDPRKVDWVEERHRLLDERAARRSA